MPKLASAAHVRSFGLAADSYDRHGPGLFSALGEELVETLDLNGVSAITDLGCGAGAITVPLSQAFGARLTAIDISKQMLKRARSEVERGRPLGKVAFRKQDMVCLELQAESQDIVLSNFSLHMPQVMKEGISEIRRILRPGGQLHGMIWAEDNWTGATGAFHRHLLALLPESFRPYATSIGPLQLQERLAWAGFVDILTPSIERTFRFEDATEYWRWLRGAILTVEMLEAMEAEPRLAAIKAAKAELGDEPLELTFKMLHFTARVPE